MTETAALFDHKNSGAYLKCFIDSFNSLDSQLTDPGRFPTDSRDGNGFWVPFRVYAVHGDFNCPQDDSCSWQSKELQVDVLVRYNFRSKTGEVKIVREYRQRCPKHGGRLVFPRLGEDGGAKLVMMKTKKYIQRRFYGGPGYLSLTNNNTRSRNSTGSSSVSSAGDSASASSFTSNNNYTTTSTSNNNNYTTASISTSNTFTFCSSKHGGSLASYRGDRANLRANNNTSNRRQRKKLPLYKPVLAHSRENCEACILSHCPFPKQYIPDWEFMIAGSEVNNRRNLQFITWFLVDTNGIALT